MYDLLIEIGQSFARHGVSYTALIASLLAFMRSSAVKRRIRRYLPWLFGDDSEVKQYVQNQQRIERKLDLLLQKEGIDWGASSNGLMGSPSTARTGFTFSSVVRSVVRFVVRCIIYLISKGRWRMNKLKSRKFWMAIISALLVVANDGLDLGINNETVISFAVIVVGWILGESHIDAKKVKTNADSKYTNPSGSTK